MSIVKALEQYESTAETDIAPAFFSWRAPWLSRELWLQSRIPGYSHADFLRNILSRLAFRGQKIRSRAAAIQLKEDMTRLRAFYPDAGYCVKVVQADGPMGIRMRQELALRGRLAGLGTVNIPVMRDTFELGNYIYMIEDMIIGRRFDFRRDADDYIERGLPQMMNTYHRAGIHYEPMAKHFDAALPSGIQAVKGMATDFLSAVESAFARNTAIPVSLCHGDLLPSNLCIGNDKFYLLDWDRSFTGAVVYDLLRMPLKYPGQSGRVTQAVLSALSHLQGGDARSADDQLAAYVAWRIAAAPAKAMIYQEFWRRHRLP